jgi:S-formylglutathione hydrolase FrmB
MPTHNFNALNGRVETIIIHSATLEGNLLGDPIDREVAVYLPPNYDTSTKEYPLLVDLVGYAGSGLSHAGWKSFGESVPQRVERLVNAGDMGEVIIALPDCFTSLGGNQYIDSLAMGNWAAYLTNEMLPTIEKQFRVKPGAEHRGVFGKSSGGYGAIVHGMCHASHWGAVACHSGDMAFDLVYRNDFAKTIMALDAAGGSIESFMSGLASNQKISGADFEALMVLAMAATYDPDPASPYGIQLPFTMDTCEIVPERWQAWLKWDPIQIIESETAQRNLRSLKAVYIDCGTKDQYALAFGARQFVRKLEQFGIQHCYAEFPDNHSSIDYRMDESLPFLYRALS